MSAEAGDQAASLLARIERIPFSRWHLRARVIVGSATFFDAFDALSLAFVLPVLVRAWHITPGQVGVLIATGYLGQLIGALVFGALAERYGRIKSATGAVALMSVMSLACAATGSFSSLLACRFIQGLGVGGEMPVAAAYINELSKAHGRGRFFMLYEMIFPVGLMVTGQLGTVVVPAFGWPIMFLIGGVPGLIITALLLRLPESPRWLIAKGRLAEAERIIVDMENSTTDRLAAPEIVVAASPPPPAPRVARGRWQELLGAFYRPRTLVVWALWASAYFVTNGLNNWMPTLYNSVYHLPLQDALRAGTLTNVAQVSILLVCAFTIDRVGRRRWTLVSMATGAVLLMLLGVSGAHNVSSVVALVTVSYGIVGSVNAVLYLYTPEIYPTRLRALGTGAATCWLRLASAIGPVLVGALVPAGGIASVFLMFAAVSAVGGVAALGMLETRNRRLEEVAP
ncbi:MAG: MFS transporter [Vicinamibacterales bacterium]